MFPNEKNLWSLWGLGKCWGKLDEGGVVTFSTCQVFICVLQLKREKLLRLSWAGGFALIYLEGNRIFKMKPKRKQLYYCLEGRLLDAGTGTHPSIKPESSGSMYQLRHLLEDWLAAGRSQGPGYRRRRGRYRSYIRIRSAWTFCFRLLSSWGSFEGCQRWGWGRDKKHAQPLRTFCKILLSLSLLHTMRIKIFPH